MFANLLARSTREDYLEQLKKQQQQRKAKKPVKLKHAERKVA